MIALLDEEHAALVARHRRARNGWIIAAAVLLAATIALRLLADPLALALLGPASWMWCVVGAAYHWVYWQLAKNAARRRRRRAIMNMGIISGKPQAAQARRRTS